MHPQTVGYSVSEADMDPLSLTASLITVITANSAGSKGLRRLIDYRKGSEELEDLIFVVDRTKSYLANVVSFAELNSSLIYSHDLLHSVKLILNTVQRMCSKITAIVECFADADSKRSWLNTTSRSRVGWLLRRNTLLRLRDDIKNARLELSAQLSLATA